MSDFDAILKGQQALSQGVRDLQSGMTRLATTRAVAQAQDEVNQITTSEMDEMEKRRHLAAVSQNLTMRLTSAGTDPTQIAQVTNAIRPPAINDAKDAFYQAALTKSPQLMDVANAGNKFEDYSKSLDRASAEKIQGMKNVNMLESLGLKQTKQLQDRITKFNEAMDPSKARTGGMADAYKVVQGTQALDALTQGYKKLDDIPAPQYAEMAMTLNRILTRGTPTVEGMKALIPDNIDKSATGILSWITSNPKGAQQGEFVKNLLKTSAAERSTAQGQIRMAQYARANGFRDLKDKAPQDWKNTFGTYQLSDAEHQYVQQYGNILPDSKLGNALQWVMDPANSQDPNYAAVKEKLKSAGVQGL